MPSISIGSDRARNVVCNPAASASGPARIRPTGQDQTQWSRGVGQRSHHPDDSATQVLGRAGLHDVVVDRRNRPVDEADHNTQ